MDQIQKMSQTKKALINFLLANGESCDLNDLAPLTSEAHVTNSRPILYRMRKRFIKNGNLYAAQKLTDYLSLEMSNQELKKIIRSCWKKHDVDTALEAMGLILTDKPFGGRATIEDALQICLERAQHAELFFRPRYHEAIPKIIELAAI